MFSIIILSCERKRFENLYDPDNKPGPPQLISPQDGEVCDLNPPIFEWENFGEKAGYEIGIDIQENFSSDSLIIKFQNDTIFDPAPYGMFFKDNDYFWRVRATSDRTISPIPWGEWSESYTFRVSIPFISTYQCTFYINDLKIYNEKIFISDYTGNLLVFDFADLNSPLFISEFQIGSYKYYIKKISNLFLYLSAYKSDSIEIVILSIDNLPNIATYTNFSYPKGHTTGLSFDNFYVGIRKKGYYHYGEPDTIVLFNVTNPDSAIKNKLVFDNFSTVDFLIYKNSLLVSNSYDVYIYDISNLTVPPILLDSLINIGYYPRFLGIHEQYLYIATGEDVKIYNVSNPLYLNFISTFSHNTSMYSVENGFLVGERNDVTQFYSLSLPTAPQYIGGLYHIPPNRLSILNNYIFSDSYDEIEIFKINE